MAGLIDPTVAGKYPVILGDGLLGKASNEIFTGIRCRWQHPFQALFPNSQSPLADNHKPALASSDGPALARLRPSFPGKTTSYDLSFTDGDDKYAYAGTRSVGDNQYVLHFDPDRKAFILDKIDSTFNMNITRMPGNSDPAKLSRQFPHLDSQTTEPDKPSASKDAKVKSAAKATTKVPVQTKPKRKVEKKQQTEMALPKPVPVKEKKSAKRVEEDDEEEEDDDDGGLLIEYPGGDTAKKHNDFSPAFPPPRRFDDFMDQRDSEGDADGESDDEPDMDFKLPSPVNNHASRPEPMDEDDADEPQTEEPASMDMENDLEKEMEMAFGDLENGQEGSPDGDESEISEED
ncbi:ELL-associated factor [Purpureocillium lavendulum]|uniref:ELL-associated factor n=1 Tax=Purpureocillium lavendulum TaxID=1247861 RepID=A0AB34FYX5_9HYPO|nr:ELL-associated factor [Purpureocillium lavendulum]